MRSPTEDRTARAIIRDEALRLFAERGPDAVTVRQVAAAAGVSPALVLRHYGSKDGLRTAVDEHVVHVFDSLLTSATASDDSGTFDLHRVPSLAEQVAAALPAQSPVPAYLARMLLNSEPAGRELFSAFHTLSQRALTGLVDAGRATEGGDLAARAAFLLANDLAVIMLRERLSEVLGVDPLSAPGLQRWGDQVFAIYKDGLTSTTPNR